MLKTIKESFHLSNKYIILATPLILFSLLSTLYLAYGNNSSLQGALFTLLLFFLMLSAFISGWFYMVKKAVVGFREENPNLLIKEFVAGVGEYFLSSLGYVVIVLFAIIILLIIDYIVGMKLIGDIGVKYEYLSKALVNTSELKSFLLSLSVEQIEKLNKWNVLVFASLILYYLGIMFYMPALFFNSKNPIVAAFVSLKHLFSKYIIKNIALFTFVLGTYLLLSILTTISSINPILSFVFTLINFYYVVFAMLLINKFYYQTYINN